MSVSQLAYLGIGVSDMPAWKSFATDIRDKRMWHFMLEANSIDDVGSALDLASKTGVPVVSTLGRHSNDQMVSFYMSTPSGVEVEYGWGGRLVDDATWQVQRHDRGTLWGHKIQLEPAPHPVIR